MKLTESEIEDIRLAGKNGLNSKYLDDRYVYYVSSSGKDLDWHGFNGKANKDVDAPYIVCPAHTKQTWKEYEEEQKRLEQERLEQERLEQERLEQERLEKEQEKQRLEQELAQKARESKILTIAFICLAVLMLALIAALVLLFRPRKK